MDNQNLPPRQPNNQFGRPGDDFHRPQPSTPINTGDFLPPPQPDPPAPKAKKGHKKLLITLLVLLLLGGGSATAYFFVFKKKETTPVSTNTDTTASEQKTVQPDNRLFYQLDTKVIAYDVKTQKSETITDKLPKGVTVLDLYSDSETWRLYATKQIESKVSFLFLEKGKEIETVAENNDGAFSFEASAKAEAVAFAVIAPNDPKKKKTGTQTFVVKNNKAELVYESSPLAEGSDKAGLKDPRYLLTDISSDGKKLLFNRANCLYCDGGSSATSFELDLDTKKTAAVFTAKKTQGSINYWKDGYLINETNMSGLGYSDDPMVAQYSGLSKPTASPKLIFDINEANWALFDTDDSLSLLTVETRLQNYAETGKSVFDGLYAIAGTTSKDVKKLKITGAPAVKDLTLSLGAKLDDCYSTQAATRNYEDANHTIEMGVLCKQDDTTYAYSKISSISYKGTETLVPIGKLLF